MRKDKQKAINLRKKGLSYNQISKKLSVPKSTLSSWLKEIKLSKEAQGKINKRVARTSITALIKRNKNQTKEAEQKYKKITKKAEKEFSSLKKDKLFLVGVALYWAEGYKKGASGSKWKCVDFTNSDPEMITLMMRFFRKYYNYKEEKYKIQLITHPGINEDKAINFWSRKTSIPKKQFIKSSYKISRASKGKRDKKTLTKGTVHIRINDVECFFRMIGWIEGLKNI